ncbi:MAG: hypothetical protein JST35_09470 [Armatimonadetes bacterium]|nr:hypothetical protein [Armatimonadota bacterium]
MKVRTNSFWLGVLIGILVVAASLFLLKLAIFSAFETEEVTIGRSQDSSGKFECLVVKRNSGATVSYSFSVRVRRVGSSEPGAEVLLINKIGHPDTVTASWRGETLVVVLPIGYQTFVQLDTVTVDGTPIKVRYEKYHDPEEATPSPKPKR